MGSVCDKRGNLLKETTSRRQQSVLTSCFCAQIVVFVVKFRKPSRHEEKEDAFEQVLIGAKSPPVRGRLAICSARIVEFCPAKQHTLARRIEPVVRVSVALEILNTIDEKHDRRDIQTEFLFWVVLSKYNYGTH